MFMIWNSNEFSNDINGNRFMLSLLSVETQTGNLVRHTTLFSSQVDFLNNPNY